MGALLATALAVAVAACGAASPPGAPLHLPAPHHLPLSRNSRVVVILMENKELGDLLGNASAPYVNSLARHGGLATESFAITHPSLPNYIALTSGSTQGISTDCTGCTVNAPNLTDQLDRAHVSWKGYLEDVPGPCFTGASAGGYAKRHNPFIYYDDVAHDRARCARLVGFAAFAADLRAGRLPTFVWITPNVCDDMHDCSIATGDAFLARTVPSLLHELGPHGFLILTWDEGDSNLGCCGAAAAGGRVMTVVAGPDVRAGAREAAPLDTYGVLATIERALGLPLLGAAANPQSGSLAPLFTRLPLIR